MIDPAALVIFTPLLVGFCFGKFALSGLLIGGLVSGVHMAISSSNTGGAWDNAKKYIERGKMKKLIAGTNSPTSRPNPCSYTLGRHDLPPLVDAR